MAIKAAIRDLIIIETNADRSRPGRGLCNPGLQLAASVRAGWSGVRPARVPGGIVIIICGRPPNRGRSNGSAFWTAIPVAVNRRIRAAVNLSSFAFMGPE